MKDDTTSSDALILSRIRDPWGRVSRIFCILGGIFAIMGGAGLAGLRAASDNSMLQSIANGMGLYMIGKGMFMIAITMNFKAAVQLIRSR